MAPCASFPHPAKEVWSSFATSDQTDGQVPDWRGQILRPLVDAVRKKMVASDGSMFIKYGTLEKCIHKSVPISRSERRTEGLIEINCYISAIATKTYHLILNHIKLSHLLDFLPHILRKQ